VEFFNNLLGEQAHIVGKEVGSARSQSVLTDEERDSYHNLILLCPTHHSLVDKNPEDYPVEKMFILKSEHESWVDSILSEKVDRRLEAEGMFYANIVDLAVDKCYLSAWEHWVSLLIEPSHALRYEVYTNGIAFSVAIHKAIWPEKLRDLECCIKYFGWMVNLMLNFYIDNAKTVDQDISVLKGIRFYKTQMFSQEEHDKRLELYDEWEKLLYELGVETTKCANWLADLVRKYLNPLFFIIEGKFSIEGMSEMLTVMHRIVEFSEEDKNEIESSCDERIGNWNDRISTFKKECPYI